MMPAGNDADVAADAAIGAGTMNWCFAAGAAAHQACEIRDINYPFDNTDLSELNALSSVNLR
jgi:microcompartment protein CcmK/EutM